MKNANYKTKLIVLILLLCTVTLMFSSCAEEKLDKPEDTNLEYWLLDDPNTDEWTRLTPSYQGFPTVTYLAKGYDTALDIYGNITSPKRCVTYCVGNYPILEMGIKKIVGIRIEDPDIYVWGLTINSTREEVVEIMEKMGFEEGSKSPDTYIGRKDNYRVIFRFEYNIIDIVYDSFSIIGWMAGYLYR